MSGPLGQAPGFHSVPTVTARAPFGAASVSDAPAFLRRTWPLAESRPLHHPHSCTWHPSPQRHTLSWFDSRVRPSNSDQHPRQPTGLDPHPLAAWPHDPAPSGRETAGSGSGSFPTRPHLQHHLVGRDEHVSPRWARETEMVITSFTSSPGCPTGRPRYHRSLSHASSVYQAHHQTSIPRQQHQLLQLT